LFERIGKITAGRAATDPGDEPGPLGLATGIEQLRHYLTAGRRGRVVRLAQIPAINGLVGLAIVIVLGLGFGAQSYDTFVMQTIALYGIAVYGLDVASGYAGILSLGHGAAFAVGGYTVGILAANHGLPIWVCLPASLVTGAVLGFAMGLPAIKIGGLGLGFISLGFALIAGDIALNASSLTGGNDGISGVDAQMGFGIGKRAISETTLVVLIFVVLYVVYVAHGAYRRSRFGRSALVVRDSPIGGRALGINIGAVQVVTVMTASAIGAVAGGLYTYTNQFVSPDITGLSISILFVVMVVFGGMGNTYGPLLGAAVIGPLPIELASHPAYNQYIYAALLLGVVLIRPRGLLGWTAVRCKIPYQGRARIGVGEVTSSGPDESLSGPVLEKEPTTEPVLHCEDLSRSFGGLQALDGVDLAVRAGEIVAIVGPNGSGKTTLLNVASGFYPPTGGRVWLRGQDVSGFNATRLARRGLGRTFQTPRIFPDLTVAEHVRLGMDNSPLLDGAGGADVPGDTANTLLDISFDLLRGGGMDWEAVKESRSLSHGQRRFLEIATAIARGPRVLLLDEPATGLSSEETARLVVALRRLAGSGIGVVIVEHHLDLVTEIADRVLVLHLGHVLWSGPPADLSSSAAVRDAYLGRMVR
jgi:ABC-type branched-subunit amino acid transport system ATPase component/ABC-type branched-subunit amino acid transport system permease subunit